MNKYFRAIITNYIFFFSNALFFIIITAVAVHTMGEDYYGIWVIMKTLLLLCGIGMMGIEGGVMKYASETGESATAPGSTLTAGMLILLPISLLITAILFIARYWISAQFDVETYLQEQFSQAIILIAASIVPYFMSRLMNGYLLSQLKNLQVRLIELINSLLMWTGAVVIVSITKNLIWLGSWILTIQTISMMSYYVVVVKMGWKWQINIKAHVNLVHFSVFGFLENIAIILFQLLDRILVGIILGPIAAGVYSIGTSLGLQLTSITKQITEVMIPFASYHRTLGDHDQLYETFRKLVCYSSISLAVLSSFLIIWMPEILSIWLSPEYSEKYHLVFRIIVLGYGLFTLCHPGRQTLLGIGKISYIAIIYIISSIIMVMSVYYFSLNFGLIGSAWANIIMVLLNLFVIISYKLLSKEINWNHVIKDMASGIIIPTGTFLLVPQIDSVSWIIKIIINIILFAFFLAMFLMKFPECPQYIKKHFIHNRNSA